MFILRLVLLAHAIVDFVLAILTVYRMTGIADDSLVPRGQFAAVAFSWTLLLMLGMMRPLERAWILRPTAVVIGLIGAAYGVGFAAGAVSAATFLLALMICGTLIWLCRAGWRYAGAVRDRPFAEP